MKGRWIQYSAEELAWIEARKEDARPLLHAAFVAQWARDDVTFENFRALCKRKKWYTGRSGHFFTGHESHNKGRRGYCAPGSEKGHFKKGQVPHNRKPLWSERFGRDGYIEICVPEQNPWTGHSTRYRHKHRWLWEQRNGPVPDGHALKSIDGNRHNTNPENWIAIPRALLPRLNGRWACLKYDDAPDDLKPTLLAIARLKQATAEARKGNTP